MESIFAFLRDDPERWVRSRSLGGLKAAESASASQLQGKFVEELLNALQRDNPDLSFHQRPTKERLKQSIQRGALVLLWRSRSYLLKLEYSSI